MTEPSANFPGWVGQSDFAIKATFSERSIETDPTRASESTTAMKEERGTTGKSGGDCRGGRDQEHARERWPRQKIPEAVCRLVVVGRRRNDRRSRPDLTMLLPLIEMPSEGRPTTDEVLGPYIYGETHTLVAVT